MPNKSQQNQDSLVTLTCDENLPLEERVELMAYAFAKMVQGTVLRTITKWDIANGCVTFIIGHVAGDIAPRGKVCAELEDAPRLSVEMQLIRDREDAAAAAAASA